jgi:hypothetical protein
METRTAVLTAAQKLRRHILLRCDHESLVERISGYSGASSLTTGDDIDAAWDVAMDYDLAHDAKAEVREGEVETGIPCDWSRHYESKSVAVKVDDGSWVGWTYWYGGGKHGAPGEVEWIEDAYHVNVTEEEKMMTVRTFTKGALLDT